MIVIKSGYHDFAKDKPRFWILNYLLINGQNLALTVLGNLQPPNSEKEIQLRVFLFKMRRKSRCCNSDLDFLLA